MLSYWTDAVITAYKFPKVSSAPYNQIPEISETNTDSIFDTEAAGTDLGISENVLKNRLRQQWPLIMRRAIQTRSNFPDPVQSLIDLFGNIPGDPNTLRDIIEEPYG
jgi:hypothetical protein